MADDAGFLSRWARRKAEVKGGKPVPAEPLVERRPPSPPGHAEPGPPQARDDRSASVRAAPVEGPGEPGRAEVPAPTLDDVASLVPGEEISRFVASGVDENVKRAAIKKLFTDPHYNVMDGLDIYIDDYSLPDPIPLAMLRQMNQSKFLGLFAKEEAEEAEQAAAAARAVDARTDTDATPTDLPAQDAGPAQADAVPQTPDEDADLQLQPDDDARRPGAATRAGPDGV